MGAGEEMARRRFAITHWVLHVRHISFYAAPSHGCSTSPISIRSPGDWSMRNLSTGSNVYLYPSSDLSESISAHAMHRHIHRCRAELSLLKHSLGPKLMFHIMQFICQAPVLWPAPLAPVGVSKEHIRHFIRKWFTTPLAELFLQSGTYQCYFPRIHYANAIAKSLSFLLSKHESNYGYRCRDAHSPFPLVYRGLRRSLSALRGSRSLTGQLFLRKLVKVCAIYSPDGAASSGDASRSLFASIRF